MIVSIEAKRMIVSDGMDFEMEGMGIASVCQKLILWCNSFNWDLKCEKFAYACRGETLDDDEVEAYSKYLVMFNFFDSARRSKRK